MFTTPKHDSYSVGAIESALHIMEQMEAELRTLFEQIDAEDFTRAREKIAALEKQLGEHDPELTRARALITFLEDSE